MTSDNMATHINSKHPDKEKIKELISLNPDSHQYFYAKADARWLSWLWENGFLDVIKEKTEEPTVNSYRTPEISYLIKVSKEEPTEVTDIMLTVPVSATNLNRGTVEGFLQICQMLPARELKRVVPKIRNEGWVQLKVGFSDRGFEYGKMFEILAQAGDSDSILTLAEAVLAVCGKKEEEGNSRQFGTDNPFYFRGLEYTRVFEHLAGVDRNHVEGALALVTNTLSQIVLQWGSESTDQVFGVLDGFHLIDVDFFTLGPGKENTPSYRDDVRQLAVAVKVLAERTIGNECRDAERASELYKAYFETLPDSRSMWRLKLFVMSLCPEALKDKLKEAFFRLFTVEAHYGLILGTEYQKALQVGFSVLSEEDKREYVKGILAYFGRDVTEEEDQSWLKTYGWRISSCICSHLTEEEKNGCEETFGRECDPAYEAMPSISRTRGGLVVPKGPVTQEEFGDFTLVEIAEKLRTEWTPEKLESQNSYENFLNPQNAEGVGQLLKRDICTRLRDYVTNAGLFFEPGILHPHYTYSFLRGVHEILRESKADVEGIDWSGVIALCAAIMEAGKTGALDNERDDRGRDLWISSWAGVHSVMTDVIEELLGDDGSRINFGMYRDEFFGIIRYLLEYPDPVPEDEKIESAKMKKREGGSEEYFVSDPFAMAINTVRGRAFQNLVWFIYEDGKRFASQAVTKVSEDVKELYETTLRNEKTRAIMFEFGHYLPSFYFRDEAWIQKLLDQIFPAESEKKDLYTAAWEGYLSANIYDRLFANPDIQNLYEQGLSLTEADFPRQAHFKNPDELIAGHLALAFVHFAEFSFDHDLFKKFWDIGNPERHIEFISFIGRYCVSRNASAQWIKDNNVDVEKIKAFWDWALKNCNNDELVGFGNWINADSDLLDIKWLAKHARQTLEKTDGYVEWEYGLTRLLPAFAKEAPEDTLGILRSHLLEEVAKHEPIRTWPNLDDEVLDSLGELYGNQRTREGVKTLINDLLPHRNGAFWGLKSIIEENG